MWKLQACQIIIVDQNFMILTSLLVGKVSCYLGNSDPRPPISFKRVQWRPCLLSVSPVTEKIKSEMWQVQAYQVIGADIGGGVSTSQYFGLNPLEESRRVNILALVIFYQTLLSPRSCTRIQILAETCPNNKMTDFREMTDFKMCETIS